MTAESPAPSGRLTLPSTSKVECTLPPSLLTVDQAAEQLGVTVHAIRKWIRLRQIEYVKIGDLVRIKQSTLDEMIEAGTVPVGGRAA